MKTSTKFFCSYRFLIVVLLAGSYMSIELVQSSIGMAIICMVDPKDLQHIEQNVNDTSCSENITEPDYGGTLDWSIGQQSLVLSAFQWGVLLSPFTGWLSDKVNAKWLLTTSVLLTAVSGAVIPLLAQYSVVYVIVARVLMGVGEAILIPAVNALIARWIPT